MSSLLERFEEDYQSSVARIREYGKTLFMDGYDLLVFTNGCFDLLHLGHLEVLRYCRDRAGLKGAVVVGINSDASVRKLKGDFRPIQDELTRASILVSLKYVDHVVSFDEDTPLQLIEALKPDVIVKGGDYDALNVVGRKIAPVEIAPLLSNQSSSALIRRIREQ